MNYATLVGLIEKLEARWQAKLPSKNPDERLVNGETQFFAVLNDPNKKSFENLPVVLAIGINYTQSKNIPTWPKVYLGGTLKSPKVTDTSPRMFDVLDATFEEYSNNPSGWATRCLASDVKIPVPKDYILLATNFSPLITLKSWQTYPSACTANLLTLFCSGFNYLDDLMTHLKSNGIRPNVIVGHGLGSEVPMLFRQWQSKHGHLPWLLTANLARPLIKGPNAFYNKPLPEREPDPIGFSRNCEVQIPDEPEIG